MPRIIDLTGQRFGRLVALKCIGRNRQGNAVWLCLCDCGEEHTSAATHLREGDTQSCGCLQRDLMSARRLDLTGQRFERLTALESVGLHRNGCVLWRCQCACGNEHVADTGHLQAGDVQSCGCLSRELLLTRRLLDITGWRFGRLVAVKRVGLKPGRGAMWLCQCDCGEEYTSNVSNLRSGRIQSCGCLHRELARERMRRMPRRTGRAHHSYKHGGSGSVKYKRWRNQQRRRRYAAARDVLRGLGLKVHDRHGETAYQVLRKLGYLKPDSFKQEEYVNYGNDTD